MAGDPKECRQRAAKCVALANVSKNANDKRMLIGIAATWQRLADELERPRSIIDDHQRRLAKDKD